MELGNLNVVIGANGAGKSNFVQVFRMLMAMTRKNFTKFILEQGGADNFLFNGPKITPKIDIAFEFESFSSYAEGPNQYRFELTPTADERFLINEEREYVTTNWRSYGSPSEESRLYDERNDKSANGDFNGVGHFVYQSISDWMVYHFHDTSSLAPMRRSEIIEDHHTLRGDAANIAPFLLNLKSNESYNKNYTEIVDAIRVVIPFFDDFRLDVHWGKLKRKSLAGHKKVLTFQCNRIIFPTALLDLSVLLQRYCNHIRHQQLSLMSRNLDFILKQFPFWLN